jgi:hypothetical protein
LCLTMAAMSTNAVRRPAPGIHVWSQMVDRMFANLAFRVDRVVSENRSMMSPNAYKRNDWTPRDRVTYRLVIVNGDGVNVTPLVDGGLDNLGSWNRRRDAEAAAETERDRLRDEWMGWHLAWIDGDVDDDEAALLGLSVPA